MSTTQLQDAGARGLAGDELRGEAAELDREAEQHEAIAKAMRFEAGKLRSRAERLDDPARSVKVTTTARDRVRADGLLAAAGVEAEGLPPGFKPADLAAALGIRDEPRALKLLLALDELGKVTRHGDGGWMVVDAEEASVRDYVVANPTFTLADVIEACSMSEMDASHYINRLRDRGLVTGGGGHYTYVPAPDDAPREHPTRKPPEKDPPAYRDAPRRGEPVRIVDHGKRATATSRHREKLRDQRWETMQQAQAAARAAAQVKAEKRKRDEERRRRRRS